VDQLNAFAAEVTRVGARGRHRSKLGGQAEVPGVAGTWKDLTDSATRWPAISPGQVRNIAEVATAIAAATFRGKITVDVRRRDPSAEGDAQHDGRPAQPLWRAR